MAGQQRGGGHSHVVSDLRGKGFSVHHWPKKEKKVAICQFSKASKDIKMSEPSYTSPNGSHLLWTNPPVDSNDKLGTIYLEENLGTLGMNSRNQKGVNAKAEGLNISFWGTQKHGVTIGLHTESTACWEADQKGGRGWATWQRDRAGGGQGGSPRRPWDRHGGFRSQVSRIQAPALSPHDARGPITQGNTPRWTQLGRHWALTRGAGWARGTPVVGTEPQSPP